MGLCFDQNCTPNDSGGMQSMSLHILCRVLVSIFPIHFKFIYRFYELLYLRFTNTLVIDRVPRLISQAFFICRMHFGKFLHERVSHRV